MEVREYREYSQHLNRDMSFKVYGSTGKPFVWFACQGGRYFDFEGFKMLDALQGYIESGRIQVFCPDSIDDEGLAYTGWDKQHAGEMMEAWFHYITEEFCPRVFQINAENQSSATGLVSCGASMGASHAANMFFRRPDIFDTVIAISGAYSVDMFFGDYMDTNLYNNSPINYLANMPTDHHYIDLYNNDKIVIVCGQGAWEDQLLDSTYRLKNVLESKGIHAWVDIWGKDVNHDWPWWFIMMPYFIDKLGF